MAGFEAMAGFDELEGLWREQANCFTASSHLCFPAILQTLSGLNNIS
jgi:hypothetical protein